jgi:hypothetical protein
MNLKERIAADLGWKVEECNQFSLSSLRDLVLPVNPKLAYEISVVLREDWYLLDKYASSL